jgi:hypothetical protein
MNLVENKEALLSPVRTRETVSERLGTPAASNA